jgi:putative oxidoreductase
MHAAISALGRLLLGLIFVHGGINKIGAIGATVGVMTAHGIPAADILVYGAIAMEVGVGALLIAGLFTRWAALALFFYTLLLALLFHAYWSDADAAAARTDSALFFGHLSMMGGMLYVFAFGPGPFSLDAMLRRDGA